LYPLEQKYSRYNLSIADLIDNGIVFEVICVFSEFGNIFNINNESSTMIKIGLLLCDDVDRDAQAEFGSYRNMFQNGLDPSHSLIDLVPIRCFDGELLPEKPSHFSGYVISGSKHGVYDNLLWITNLLQFIRDCWISKTRMIGVCFGHQAIAHALGGHAEKSTLGWGFGIQATTVRNRQAWMKDYEELENDDYNLVVIHQDQVVKLPPMFKTIADNHFCPNSMIIADTTMLGIQGHPEFSADYCRFRAE